MLFDTWNEKEIYWAAIIQVLVQECFHIQVIQFHGNTVRSLMVFLLLGMKQMA